MVGTAKTIMHDDRFQVGPNEPPPSYSSQTESGSTSVASPSTFKTKPTNFLALSTADTPIRGEFVIDPSLHLPSSMLPPLSGGETEEDRKNLSLTSRYGSIQADIWLLGSSSGEGATGSHNPRRTTISLKSDYGWIRAQLHSLDGAAPFSLTARGYQWTTRIALPRSFKGLMLLSAPSGSVILSDALLQNATQLSQLGNTQQYFVGDAKDLAGGEWEGNRVEVEAAYGWVRVKYLDEVAEAQGTKGLFGWLFGK